MKIRVKILIGTTALALSVGGSLAAFAASSPQPPAQAPAKAALLLPVDTSTEAKFTAITPCRIVDTRIAGGRISTSTPRSFVATGSSGFAAQGGKSTGCGIPSAAVAIQANVVTVGGTGSGFLKIYPFGAAAPNSSYMNYRDSAALANGGTITLNVGGAKEFTVATASHSTYVVIDVSGYFVKPMWAEVSTDASLIRSSRTTGTVKLATGQYEVDFDRDVSNCSYSVTPFVVGTTVGVEPRSGNADGVFVYFANTSGTIIDSLFYLSVDC
ncbi:MAG: hypothetical protein M3P23_16030 [Actinomycetota bacterium]|nr:hypothetical protein [Actinomycetota bacterium]